MTVANQNYVLREENSSSLNSGKGISLSAENHHRMRHVQTYTGHTFGVWEQSYKEKTPAEGDILTRELTETE
jgi:hypothetical protein